MDRIYTENLELTRLPELVSGEFAAHWEITLDFLRVLSVEWVKILETLGVIDASDRKNRLLTLLAAHWRTHPPAGRVIAAGSTGSIPASAQLLKVIAGLPQGCVILPGLDCAMDADSWAALDDNHPQATLRQLLKTLAIEKPDAVQLWPGPAETPEAAARRALASEMMRPAATTGEWARLSWPAAQRVALERSLGQLMRCDAATPQEEARLIAVLMRQALETPERTVALVTPDRRLARRVAMACRRWGIILDDSGGQPLSATGAGSFLRVTGEAFVKGLAPAALLALLRHSLCTMGQERGDLEAAVSRLEIKLLRGPKPPAGFEGLRNRLAEKSGGAAEPLITSLLDRLETAAAPFSAALAAGEAPFAAWCDAHIAMAEALAPGQLWRGGDGEEASRFLAQLREEAGLLPPMTGETYLALLSVLMKDVTVRPAYGAHPRLFVLGQLEARLLQADLVILAALNEGTWPPAPAHEPWMSRPMMQSFGLPTPERAIGLAAHDFVQGFCAPALVLTRAVRVDGAPTVPARWLQRLDTVLEALSLSPELLRKNGENAVRMAQSLDLQDEFLLHPVGRPEPRPPLALRPRALSVTEIETWRADPYSLYAKHVLRLKKLDPLEKPVDMADRGTFLHKVLEGFMAACRHDLPGSASDIILDLGRSILAKRADDPGSWEFWWPRFERIADWLCAHEDSWRQGARNEATEAEGRLTLPGPAGPFVLSARADRIDRLADGRLAVIDYKSGGSYSKSGLKDGDLPQLPLEALIAREGGFAAVAPAAAGYLGYWILTGSDPAGEEKALTEDCDGALEAARTGLLSLIALFDNPDTPYYSLPDPDRAPRFNNYTHLARVQEWTALGEAEEGAA